MAFLGPWAFSINPTTPVQRTIPIGETGPVTFGAATPSYTTPDLNITGLSGLYLQVARAAVPTADIQVLIEYNFGSPSVSYDTAYIGLWPGDQVLFTEHIALNGVLARVQFTSLLPATSTSIRGGLHSASFPA